MRILRFLVHGQNLEKSSYCNFDGIQRGTKGYLLMQFAFSKDWSGCVIAATFWDYDKEICAVPVMFGKCKIPDEVTDKRRIKVSLTGKSGQYKITTNKITISQEG